MRTHRRPSSRAFAVLVRWVHTGVWGLDIEPVMSVHVAEKNSGCDAPESLSQGGVSAGCVEQWSVGRRYARPASAKKQ
jgi:hypothetical protein